MLPRIGLYRPISRLCSHCASPWSVNNYRLYSLLWKNNTIRRRNLASIGVISRRNITFLKLITRAGKIPAYVGGTFAAGGSYVAYKMEQASNYAQDKISTFKDYTDGFFQKSGDFLKSFGNDSQGEGNDGSNQGLGGQGGGDGGNGDVAATVATAAAVGVSSEDQLADDIIDESETFDDDEETLIEDDSFDDEEADDGETSDQMLNITRQMIEIRNLLASIDHGDSLRLPSIVVIGSQSSGKSSVLEALVGQEFLPKGLNMVTRRPIELTLVNSPESASESADFPALRMHNLTDFSEVQKILHDLNMAVPLLDCISDDPIQVTIRSPRVPDLSLVDLPGYIQVEALDQPAELKQKIRRLCNRYLDAPNIILAISAADVDLANSAALRASKVSDPRGERTIGVITKLDLVPPDRAKSILLNKKYPLKMGYIGVVTKSPKGSSSAGSLFSRKVATGYQAYVAQQNYETNYLREKKEEFYGTTTGTRNLKKKLIKVLEKSMATSLRPTHIAIQQELEETSYRFKVEFNDRQLTPQTYLANNIDLLKIGTQELSHSFSRNEIRSILKCELDQRVLDLLAERYWNKPFNLQSQSNVNVEPDLRELLSLGTISDDSYWHRKLDLATSSLTKLGVGRLSTSLLTNCIITEVLNLVRFTDLRNHPMAKEAVKDAAKAVLSSKYYSTADQVENCIKPYKYEIEIEDREWDVSHDNAVKLLREELKQCEDMYGSLKKQIGGRKLQQVVKYLEKLKQQHTLEVDLDSNEALGFSSNLIEKGREAIFLRDRVSLLKMRYQFVKNSKKCKKKENKYNCPEIFLDAVASKITSTAILFLNVELLSDFYYNFPRELDLKFFSNLTPDEVEALAKEDPKIKKHIELQERKDLLEAALTKIESVLAIQRNRGGQFNESSDIKKNITLFG